MPHFAEFCYDYEDLARLSGMGKNAIWQHVRRGNLDAADLESVLVWLARHGRLALRQRLVAAALGAPEHKAKPTRKKAKRRTVK